MSDIDNIVKAVKKKYPDAKCVPYGYSAYRIQSDSSFISSMEFSVEHAWIDAYRIAKHN